MYSVQPCHFDGHLDCYSRPLVGGGEIGRSRRDKLREKNGKSKICFICAATEQFPRRRCVWRKQTGELCCNRGGDSSSGGKAVASKDTRVRMPGPS